MHFPAEDARQTPARSQPDAGPGHPSAGAVRPGAPVSSFRTVTFTLIEFAALVLAAELTTQGIVLACGPATLSWGAGLLRAAILIVLLSPLLAWRFGRQADQSARRGLGIRGPRDPASGLRWVTLTALGIVTAVALGMFGIEQQVAESAATHSRLLNLAGRQRMLSQRLARFATSPRGPAVAAPERRTDEIAACLKELRENFAVLDGGIRAEATADPLLMRESIPRFRVARQRYDELVAATRAVLAADMDGDGDAPGALLRTADEFLAAMHVTVLALQHDFEQFVVQENGRRLMLTLLLVGTIAGVYGLMIDPAIRQLRIQHRDVQSRAEELDRLSLVARMTTDAVLITDAETRIVWGNEGWKRISGPNPDAIAERSLLDVLIEHEADSAGLSAVHRTVEEGTGGRTELRIRTPAGHDHWAEAEIQPLYEPAGRLHGFIVVLSDITALRKKRVSLVEQVRQLEEAEESARLGHWSWDTATGAVRWSRQVYRVHRLDEAAGPPDYAGVLALYDSASATRLSAAVDRALSTGDDYDLVLRTSDADERYLAARGHVRRDSEGRITELHGTVRDVTAEVMADRSRAESEERYRQLADSIPTMTWLSGPDTRCTDFNKAWLEFRGRPLAAELGDGWTEGVHPEDLAGCLAAYRAAFEAREPYATSYRLLRHDGVYRWIEAHGVARQTSTGEFLGYAGGCIDITDRLEAVAALGEATRDLDAYRKIVDEHAVVVETDTAGEIVFVNAAFCRFSGYSRAELIGRNLRLLKSGHHPDSMWEEMYQTVAAGGVWHGEVCNLARDGHVFWLDTTIAPLYEADGHVRGYFAVSSEITQLKESQRHLRESEEFLERAGQVAGVGGWELDLVGQELRWTAQTCRIHEVPLDSRPTLAEAISFYAPEARPLIRAAVERASTDGEPWDLELPLVTATGRPIWVRAVGQAEFLDGRPVRLFGAFQDITRRKLAESEAVHASALVRGVLDAASELSIIAVNPQGLITIFNRGAERLLGYTAREVIGQQTPVVLHLPEEVQARAAELSREHGCPVEGFRVFVEQAERYGSERREWTYVRRDGSRFPVSLTVNVIRTELGEITGYLGIAQDISARKQAEESLLATNRSLEEANRRAEDMAVKAEEASRLKSEFLANMSHEIRTPMTAIIGYTDLLAEEEDFPLERDRRQDYIATIRRNSEHLLTLINDILDVSKIEAGKMMIERVVVQPMRLLQEVRELMLVKAQAKGIPFDVICDGELPGTIESDPVRLKQILVNLVSNAIKFTELGRVTVRAKLETGGPHGPVIRFDVQDTGIGMTEKQLGRLFEAFQQADATTTRRFGGTGLGLRISRRLAELLGGEITVHSQPGQGSTFTVRIAAVLPSDAGRVPCDPPAAAPQVGERRQQPLAGVRILFVEDGPDNQRLISFLLRRAGATVRMFENGRRALESLTRDGSVESPLADDLETDVILTDMQMPEMDGYTFARELRAKGCALPIVALTANAMGGDGQKCLAAGCDYYASKPIEQARLIELLRVALESNPRVGTMLTR